MKPLSGKGQRSHTAGQSRQFLCRGALHARTAFALLAQGVFEAGQRRGVAVGAHFFCQQLAFQQIDFGLLGVDLDTARVAATAKANADQAGDHQHDADHLPRRRHGCTAFAARRRRHQAYTLAHRLINTTTATPARIQSGMAEVETATALAVWMAGKTC